MSELESAKDVSVRGGSGRGAVWRDTALLGAALVCVLGSWGGVASAQDGGSGVGAARSDAPVTNPEGDHPPEDVQQEVGIVERPDAQVPLGLRFNDEQGELVELGSLFDGERPVILALVYYRCPSLCNLVLNGMVDVLQRMEWSAGQGFDVITVSINPQETAPLARDKKRTYLKDYGREGAEDGWRFLTGLEGSIRPLAESVGFGYKFDTQSMEYAHSAALFVLTPDGRVSRTLYGVAHEPKTVKFSLLEAADGKIGTALDRLILYCYHYDPDTGTYTPVVMNIMRLAALTTVGLLGLMVGAFFWLERRQRAVADGAEPEASTGLGAAE